MEPFEKTPESALLFYLLKDTLNLCPFY